MARSSYDLGRGRGGGCQERRLEGCEIETMAQKRNFSRESGAGREEERVPAEALREAPGGWWVWRGDALASGPAEGLETSSIRAGGRAGDSREHEKLQKRFK